MAMKTLVLLLSLYYLSSPTTCQRTCPKCGSMEIPYPLSTSSNCGDPSYSLSCDPSSRRLYLDALNGSSYLVLAIHPSSQRLVVQPAPWLPGATCTTRDMPRSEGLWLNQSLPFNITTSNTIFLFHCSPRLLVSPLNCTAASLCHRHPAGNAPPQCASAPAGPCCTFVPGGTPSAYRIRLHSSGCRAFRSVLRLDPAEPPSRWEEGLEIQWAAPQEPACRAQKDCGSGSTCAAVSRRCLCNKGYYWDAALAACTWMRSSSDLPSDSRVVLIKSVAGGLVGSLTILTMAAAAMAARYRSCRGHCTRRSNLAKGREDELKARNGGRPVRIFRLKELRKATSGFAKDRLLGSGGYGEVYKGVLEDGTTVAVKLARVGNLRSTQQVLNEVEILSVVSHKNLVRLLGCCVEANQPMMVYEYIPNGTLHQHLHNNNKEEEYSSDLLLDWKARLKIAVQTADAIAYLHSSTETPIYHRDIKSTNILLDMELNAKVSDFGLSRLAEPGLSHVSTCAQGTLGYLDPVYYRNYQLTDKSDVYSFGVVLLELLTSETVVDFSRGPEDVNLAVYATRRADDGAIMELADRRLFGADAPRGVLRSAEQFSELAVACLREERPSMKEVAQVLKYIIEMLD